MVRTYIQVALSREEGSGFVHDTPTQARTTGVVAVLALAGTTAAIMQTLVTPLLPRLPDLLDTTPGNATWVITVTLLVSGVCVPVSGRLGDLFGKRRMMLACLVPLIVGSLVCAVAPGLAMMLVGRSLQGMGMGMLPLGIALLRDVVPKERLSSSIALVSASMGIGSALGLPLSAGVAQYVSWRSLFWGAAVLATVIALLVRTVVPNVPAQAGGQRFDGPGALGLGAGLVCLLLAVSKGADWGWGSTTTLGCFAGAVVLFLCWGWWELRTRDPLIDLRSTARPRVLLTNIAAIFTSFAMYASMLVMPQLLQLPKATGYGLGQSLLHSGLWMAPGGVMMMLISPLGGKLTDAKGPKCTLLCGGFVIALGYVVSLALMGAPWGITLAMMVINGGVGFAYGAFPALIMSSVRQSETGAANGFNTLMRSLGTTIGAAVMGVLLAQMTTTFGGETLTSQGGFRTGLLVGCGMAVVSMAVAAAIPAVRAKADAEQDGAAEDGTPQVAARA